MSGISALTYDEFMKYKEVNKAVPPEVQDYIKSLGTHKQTKGGPWKRAEKTNNWLLQMKFNQGSDDKLYSQFRSLLNKISESNFNQLAEEIVNLQIQKKYHLERLVDLIFQKAISEEKFNEMYAKLCKELASYYIEEKEEPEEEEEMSDEPHKSRPKSKVHKIYFREILINKCQQMFTQAISLEKDVEGDNTGSAFKYKEQVVGCMSFIGQLYLQDLLINKIIYSCFTLLHAKAKLNKAYIVDSMCTLMSTVGKKFLKNSPTEAKDCFDKMEKMKNEVSNVRDKFAIMDLLDRAKKEKW